MTRGGPDPPKKDDIICEQPLKSMKLKFLVFIKEKKIIIKGQTIFVIGIPISLCYKTVVLLNVA